MESSNSSQIPTRSSTSTSNTSSLRRSIWLQPSQVVTNCYENDPNPVVNTSLPFSAPSSNLSSNYQLHLVHRSDDNCPSEIDGSKRTKWNNAGKKAKQNFAVISSVPPFVWPITHYDAPIFINWCTTELTLISSLQRIADVHLFMIDTESDFLPGEQRPPRPALLQIQAIHSEDQATVFLVEVQHLPPSSSSAFLRIQHLCHTIFSPNNTIMAWGDVLQELRSFSDFHLFDISHVVKITNLQEQFTHVWNQHHPHTPDCLAAIAQASIGKDKNDVLISAILYDDDDDEEENNFGEIHMVDKFADSNHCICSPTSRPYKIRNAKWQLQRAVHLCLHRALDKSLTLQIWSCGLDPALCPSLSSTQRTERDAMIIYAINDVFAPTHLYFHIRRQTSSSSFTLPPRVHPTISSSSSLSTTTITRTDPIAHLSTTSESPSSTFSRSVTSPPLIVVVADSHFKFLPSSFISNTYRLSTQVRSGLSWLNPYDSGLCTTTLLQSDLLSSSLSSAIAVFLFVGTNSLRSLPANLVIDQVQDIILYLHSNYPHLTSTSAITINHTFPCTKLTKHFPNTHELSTNINMYNDTLTSLSHSNNFSILKFPILSNHLYNDGIHIRHQFNHLLSETLHQYIQHLIPSLVTLNSTKISIPLTNVTETTLVVPPCTTSTCTPNIDPSPPDQDVKFNANLDVVEINIPSDEELDPVAPTLPDLVQPHPISKSNRRSTTAKKRRNEKRHEQQKQQYKEHPLRRQVHPSWTIPQIRNFLLKSNIPFGRVNPRRGTVVTILFSNEEHRQHAIAQLPNDIFDELHYNRWMTNQPQR